MQPVEGRASAEHRDRQKTSSQTAPSTTVCLVRHSQRRRMTCNAAAPHLTHSGSPGRSRHTDQGFIQEYFPGGGEMMGRPLIIINGNNLGGGRKSGGDIPGSPPLYKPCRDLQTLYEY